MRYAEFGIMRRKLSKEFSHIPTPAPVLVKYGFSAHSSVVRFLMNVFSSPPQNIFGGILPLREA